MRHHEENIYFDRSLYESTSSDWQKTCHEVFLSLNSLFQGIVVNKELAIPLDVTRIQDEDDARRQYISRYQIWYNKLYGKKALLAKNWVVLAGFIFAVLREFSREEDTRSFLNPIFFAIVLIFFMKLYHALFVSIPLQSVGLFFLNSEQKRLCELQRRCDLAYKQAERVGPLSSWHFFCGVSELDKAMRDKGVTYYEHEAMLRGLFSVENKAFDCIAISAITILKLIEKKIPVSIERLRTPQNAIDAHSYVVVNRVAKSKVTDIGTWNEDCIILDPWYEICSSVQNIRNNPSFFLQYPLLDTADKICEQRIRGDNPPRGYLIYLQKLQTLLAENEVESCCFISKE